MTEVAFHFNVPDRLAYACRLLRKAVNNGAQLVVTGLPNTLQELSGALWTLSPTDFVPHCDLQCEARVVAASPVLLAASIEQTPRRKILVNLGSSVPMGFERFERVIELVGRNAQERESARNRWRHYVGAGHLVQGHDLAVPVPH